MPDPFAILSSDGTVLHFNSGFASMASEGAPSSGEKRFRILEELGDKIKASLETGNENFSVMRRDEKHYEVYLVPYISKGEKFLSVLFRDMTGFVGLQQELMKKNRELLIINSLSGAFIASDDLDLATEALLGKILLVTDFEAGIIATRENEAYSVIGSVGISREGKTAVMGEALERLCHTAAESGEPIYIFDEDDLSENGFASSERITFLAAVPLMRDGGRIGLIFFADRKGKKRSFDLELAALLSLVGNHVSLILEKIRLFQETKRLSFTDGLTGLYNTRYLYQNLEIETARNDRYGGTFSIIIFDIDNFKNINDTYGHQAGDDALHEIARILKSEARETDTVVRYGGEEFVIILPNTSDKDSLILAERVRAAVENNLFLINYSGGTRITVSGGIASYPKNASDARTLLNAADTALYSAKRAGKNRIIFFRKDSAAAL